MTGEFHYFEASPQQWGNQLGLLNERGSSVVRVPCLWGAHESTKGIRDFTRSPKLRLEKLFNEAKRNGQRLEMVFGFPPHPLSFPQWTMGEGKRGFNVRAVWDKRNVGYEFSPIPSFVSKSVQKSYLEFLDEALALVSMYVGENGAVESICFDLGVLSLDLTLVGTDSYSEHFQKKYSEVEVFNKKFSTHFRSLPVSHLTQTFRTLFEKRPWLTAYDYREFRREILERFENRIKALPAFQALSSEVKIQFGNAADLESKSHRVIIDKTFLDALGDRLVPFFPEVLVNPMSAYAYRIGEFFFNFARDNGYGFNGISESALLPRKEATFHLAIAGKYLSSHALEFFLKSTLLGQAVFFPFGLPPYNESSSEIQWFKLGKREIIKDSSFPIQFIQTDRGRIYYPVGSVAVDEKLCQTLLEYERRIRGHQP